MDVLDHFLLPIRYQIYVKSREDCAAFFVPHQHLQRESEAAPERQSADILKEMRWHVSCQDADLNQINDPGELKQRIKYCQPV